MSANGENSGRRALQGLSAERKKESKFEVRLIGRFDGEHGYGLCGLQLFSMYLIATCEASIAESGEMQSIIEKLAIVAALATCYYIIRENRVPRNARLSLLC